MTSSPFRLSILCLASLLLIGATAIDPPTSDQAPVDTPEEQQAQEKAVKVQYLEIVTPAVDETCTALADMHNVVFGDPIPQFGNARTADLKDGGMIGVRAPMRETETPVVRPYVLVDDIEVAVKAAKNAGAQVALPPMTMPGGHGRFSVYILGGIEHGLWELEAED